MAIYWESYDKSEDVAESLDSIEINVVRKVGAGSIGISYD